MTYRKTDHVEPTPIPMAEEIVAPGLVPVEETKSDKFVRLAQARTIKIIKYIRSVGKLSTSAYDYTDEQVDSIVGVIRKEADELERRLRGVKPAQIEFTLR